MGLFSAGTGAQTAVVSGATTYQADSAYYMTVTASSSGFRFGFELTVVDAAASPGNMAGTIVRTNTTTTTLGTYTPSGSTQRQYIGHKNASTSVKTWTFKWTAPHTGVGPLTIYYVGMNANNNGNEVGDLVYSATKVIREQLPTVPLALSLGSNQTVCTGHQLSLSPTVSGGTAGYSYAWSSTGDALSCSNCANPTATITQNSTFTVTVTDASNATITGTVSVNAQAVPTPQTISGNTTVTASQTYPYSVSTVSGITSTWSVTGGTIQSGQGTDNITVQWGSTEPYLVSVIQSNALGCSDTLNLTVVGTTLGINQVGANYQYSVYPNPANNTLYVQTKGAEVEQLNIYNSTGSLISQAKLSASKGIDVSEMAVGIYILEIKTKEATVKRRWVRM